MQLKTPQLFVVATPIGNLEDMTLRAKRILNEVDLIAAEDTRQARKLLNHLNILGKDVVSYHDHNEQSKAHYLIAKVIEQNLHIALVTDAGTPAISDPGYRLVLAAHQARVAVHPIPGASALTALVSASGLPNKRVLFLGFLPSKTGALKAEIESWKYLRGVSIVFFESARRVINTLAYIEGVFANAQVVIGRELTKLYEEIQLLPIHEARLWLSAHTHLKGEVSVMVYPAGDQLMDYQMGEDTPSASASADHATERVSDIDQFIVRFDTDVSSALQAGASFKDLLQKYRECGLSRSELYQALLVIKNRL